MKVSVILPSYRIGGLDVSFAGLGNQTFKDYEVIFVDALYERRKQLVEEHARKNNVPLKHIPPKKDTIPLHAPNNFENTGILASSGELIIMFGDYQYAPPDWIENHWQIHQNNPDLKMIVAGSLDIYDHPDLKPGINHILTPNAYYAFMEYNFWPDINDKVMISVFREPFNPEMLKTLRVKVPDARGINPCPAHYTWIILKNDSAPIEVFEKLNGLDESLDFGSGYQDTDFAYRALTLGYRLQFDPSNKVYQLNHRDIIPPLKRLWNSQQNEAKVNRKIALMNVGKVPLMAANDFSIKETRGAIR